MGDDSMPMGDIPQISTASYASTSYVPDAWDTAGGAATGFTTTQFPIGRIMGHRAPFPDHQQAFEHFKSIDQPQENKPMAKPTRRLVKVIIMDPDENVPLDQCKLYSGEEKLTDLTDQELFFELPIQELLAKHNEMRVQQVNKKVKERTEYLEKARIRDLKMVVVNIAEF